MTNKVPKLSIVLPIHNEYACLEELRSRLVNTLETMQVVYEIILVDDGSTDESWKEIESQCSANSSIQGIKFSRNFGHHAAISAGLEHASGDYVIVMDSDLQDAPEEIPNLFAKASEDYDIVLARRKGKQHGRIKQKLSSMFYSFLTRMSDIQFDPEIGVFRLLSKRAVREICRCQERSPFIVGISQWIGFKTAYVDVQHQPRFSGETKYPISKQLSLAVEATLSFTDRPLKLGVYMGFFFSMVGLIYALSIVIRAFNDQIVVHGYASLMSVLLILGGLILSTIGITGIYIGRIFRDIKNRPVYIVEKHCNPMSQK